MRILLNSKIPIPAPIINGVRNFELFLRSLKKFKILSKSFSYIPKITQSTPLLIPGRIAPAPIAIPFTQFTKKFIKNHLYYLTYEIKNKKFKKYKF